MMGDGVVDLLSMGLGDAIPRLCFIWIAIFFPFYALVTYVERKFSADLQARIGPNLVGPRGTLQGFANALKLLSKQSQDWVVLPEAAYRLLGAMALFASAALLPLGPALLLFDSELTLILPLFLIAVSAFSHLLVALALGRTDSWTGGIRMAAQTAVALFPALLSLLSLGVHAGSFKWVDLTAAQGFAVHRWTLFSSPFLFVAGVVFYLSGIQAFHLAPMDGAIASMEIRGGIYGRVAGRSLLLGRMVRFYGLFVWCVFTVGAFGGSWKLPESFSGLSEGWIAFFESMLVLIKAFLLMMLLFWQNRVSPRLRVDHVTNFSWRVLVPLALLSTLGETFWKFWKVH